MTIIIDEVEGITSASWTTAGRPSVPVASQQGFNTTLGTMELYNGANWEAVTTGYAATGGNITTSGIYTIHTFLSSGTFTPNQSGNVDYLVVGGGGGGGLDGYSSGRGAGGGGGGGLKTGTGLATTAQAYTVVVGAGGGGHITAATPVGVDAGGSSFSTVSVSGGGGGGGHDASGQQTSGSGSSSGGETNSAGGIGTAVSGEGYVGGAGLTSTPYQGGGGGGASEVGYAASGTVGGVGGDGTVNSYSGSAVTYGGGGGGGGRSASAGGAGGAGGGGAGGLTTAVAGTKNTGGGGGGCGIGSGGSFAGGSGIVIIRYPTGGALDVQPIRNINLATAQDTTSTTSIDFTDIPSGVNRISVILGGVRSNGTSAILIQLGTGGSLVTSGYKAGWQRDYGSSGNNGTSTSGFPYSFDQTGQIDYGIVTFTRLTGNTWVESGALGCQDVTTLSLSGWGIIALAGEVDQLRFTTSNGSDAFNAGSINISWEF